MVVLSRAAVNFTRSGKLTDNGYFGSFNGRLRDECLNVHHILSLDHARTVIEAWRRDYKRPGRTARLAGKSLPLIRRKRPHRHADSLVSPCSQTGPTSPRLPVCLTAVRLREESTMAHSTGSAEFESPRNSRRLFYLRTSSARSEVLV